MYKSKQCFGPKTNSFGEFENSAMASHGVLVEGRRVNVTGGRYKGKAGQIEKVTAVKVQDQGMPCSEQRPS